MRYYLHQNLGTPEMGVPRKCSFLDFIPVVGDIVGGLIDTANTNSTNAANVQINAANNKFNAEQAQLDRDFQAEQATLAYDRSVDFSRQASELRAAGLNPSLMMQGNSSVGSASAASGSRASAAAPAAMQKSNVGEFIRQASGDYVNFQLQAAQEKYLEQQSQKTAAETAETLLRVQNTKKMFPEQLRQLRATIDSLNQGIRESQSRIGLNDSSIALNNALAQKANQEVAKLSTENEMLEKELSYMDENQQLHVKSVLASIFAQYASGKASLSAAAQAAALTMTENATRRYTVAGASWDAKGSKAKYYDLFYSSMQKMNTPYGTGFVGNLKQIGSDLNGYVQGNGAYSVPSQNIGLPW